MDSERKPITEEWLKSVDFKWHQFDRQPDKHWLLWLGGCEKENRSCFEDFGLELAPSRDGKWFCWFRSDTAGRYHRFIHVRHLEFVDEVIQLTEAITGLPWNPENHIFGSVRRPEVALYLREQKKRADLRIRHSAPDHCKWLEVEKDDTRGRALPEHMEAHAKSVK